MRRFAVASVNVRRMRRPETFTAACLGITWPDSLSSSPPREGGLREGEGAWGTMQRQFNFASDLRERGAYKWGLRPRAERISQTSRDGRGGRAPTFGALKLRRKRATAPRIAPLVIRALARGPSPLASSPSRRTVQFQINYEPGRLRPRASNVEQYRWRFTPRRSKEAADKLASISRHATAPAASGIRYIPYAWNQNGMACAESHR